MLEGLGQIDQFRRQGEGVGRILQERIGREPYLVHVHVRVKSLQSEWRRVADDVDLVPPFSQPDGQLRRHDTTPTVGRITEHSDLHGMVSRHSGPKNSTGSSMPQRLPHEKRLAEFDSDIGSVLSVPRLDALDEIRSADQGFVRSVGRLVRAVELRRIGPDGLEFLVVRAGDVDDERRRELETRLVVEHLEGSMGLLSGVELLQAGKVARFADDPGGRFVVGVPGNPIRAPRRSWAGGL